MTNDQKAFVGTFVDHLSERGELKKILGLMSRRLHFPKCNNPCYIALSDEINRLTVRQINSLICSEKKRRVFLLAFLLVLDGGRDE